MGNRICAIGPFGNHGSMCGIVDNTYHLPEDVRLCGRCPLREDPSLLDEANDKIKALTAQITALEEQRDYKQKADNDQHKPK